MDITKIFKSKTRKALFRIYFTNPEKEYYLRELERILDIPVSMIRKELVNLEKSGIFKSRKKGNLLYYSLDKSYPLYNELRNIVFKTIGVSGFLEKKLKKIEGLKLAFIYGSFAKKEEKLTSDIDLFLIGNIDEDELIKIIEDSENSLKREINYSLYSKEDFQKKKKEKDPFISELLENSKIFLVGYENEL